MPSEAPTLYQNRHDPATVIHGRTDRKERGDPVAIPCRSTGTFEGALALSASLAIPGAMRLGDRDSNPNWETHLGDVALCLDHEGRISRHGAHRDTDADRAARSRCCCGRVVAE